MVQVKCIEKLRSSSGKIYGYKITDINGVTRSVTPDDLKKAIKKNQVEVVNLTLTSDGRLVDKKAETLLESKRLMPHAVEEPIDSDSYKNIIVEPPYESENYTQFIKRLIPLINKTLKLDKPQRFRTNRERYERDGISLRHLDGIFGSFDYTYEYIKSRCYIEFSFNFEINTKRGSLVYNLMEEYGDCALDSYEYFFNGTHMKSDFNKVLNDTQKFLNNILNHQS